jgi:predicted rRNA methylase YqxC with S4 and FtsJ domains
MAAEVIDLTRRIALRRELAALAERNAALDTAHVSTPGQLSLDFGTSDGAFTTVISGMQFTCTTYGGNGHI